jgi:RHS repeat-associated protein
LGRLREVGSNFSGFWEQLVEDQAGQVAFEVQTMSRTVRNMFGPEPDEVLVGDRLAPTFSARTWYYQDERGSVVAAEDGTGTPRINRYDDYGVPGASNTGRFQYTGQFWLAEPSLYYYKARFYDPKLGLFLQTDPKGYDAGANLYAYVGDDPMNEGDPDGTEFRSHWLLRLLVPGQIAWDEAVNAYQRGQYVEAAGHAANMLGEQVLTVASAGTGRSAVAAGRIGAEAVNPVAISAAARYPAHALQAERMTVRQLERSIRSFDKLIEQHMNWIKNPVSKIKDWSSLSPLKQKNILFHWNEDVKRAQAYKIISENEKASRM